MSLLKQPPERNPEHVEILRSAHARADGSTFTTSCSFIVSSDGARLLAGRHVTHKAFGALARNAEAHTAASNVNNTSRAYRRAA